MIDELRERIEGIDDDIVSLIGKRMDISREIGRIKSETGMPIIDSAVEAVVMERYRDLALKYGIDRDLMESVCKLIIEQSRKVQEKGL